MTSTGEAGAGRASGRFAAGLSLLAAALVAAGCGGDGDGAAAADAPPVAEDCLESWNAETASLKFGRHVYGEHDGRQAQVTVLEAGRGAVNVKGGEACAAIFAVSESDAEYGDIGLVVTRFGWASMQELARGDRALLGRIQRQATEAPNANLFPDGTLEPI